MWIRLKRFLRGLDKEVYGCRECCYSIDLTFEAIHDMCLFGGLTYEYNGEIKDSDLKMLADSIRLEYPLPPLVICRETDKRGSVVVGKKLVATINKFASTEAYKRLVVETRYKPLRGRKRL